MGFAVLRARGARRRDGYRRQRHGLRVTDTHNQSVLVFDPAGTYLSAFGSRGSGPGEFITPWSVAVDGAGRVYVVDSGNCRVQVFDPAGTFLLAFGSKGSAPGQLLVPRGIAVDRAGVVYVADAGNDRVQVFDPAGTPLSVFGATGTGPGEFSFPAGIALGEAGRVYVGEVNTSRVQVFGTVPSAAFTADPVSGDAPLTVRFANTSSGNGITSLSWEFGDGGTATGEAPTHTYTAPGTYTVNLTVANEAGSNRVSGTVTVSETSSPGAGPGRIEFSSTRDGNYEIYTTDPAGTRLVRLTENASADRVPTWSSDGSRVAYGLRNQGIHVMNADGSGDVAVPGQNADMYPSWSPDGTWIVFRSGDGIFVMDADGSNRATLDAGAWISADPAWGRMVVRPVPPSTLVPTDTDADGLCDDVNGNDRADFADTVLYFNQMTWIAANEPLAAFDYNGNVRIDFADVVWLFNNL